MTDEELLRQLEQEGQGETVDTSTPWFLDKSKYADNSCKHKSIRAYMSFGSVCRKFSVGEYSEYFNFGMTGAIVVAGILVGAQTYCSTSQYVDCLTIDVFDAIILGIFILECVVKIGAEGIDPLQYFRGGEWGWNNFDFLIVVMSLPVFPLDSSTVKLLRLFRLMRLVKLLKRIPQLYVIVQGLIGGLKSIVYIFVLLFLVFYLYAVAGIDFFRVNDPWHWQNMGRAYLTLFRAATLEDWTDVMYIGFFGCDTHYNHFGIYANSDGTLSNRCRTPQAKPAIAAIFWVSFVLVAGLVMLSLFVGTVTMAMGETMEKMKHELELAERKKALLKNMKSMQEQGAKLEKLDSQSSSTKDDDEESGSPTLQHQTSTVAEFAARKRAKAMRELAALLHEAWESSSSTSVMRPEEEEDVWPEGWIGKYLMLAEKCKELTESEKFNNFIMCAICVASVLVGLMTDECLMCEPYDDDQCPGVSTEGTCESKFILEIFDNIVSSIFCIEVILKIIAEDFTPLAFFNDTWNCFDFIVVVGTFIPAGGFVNVLRLLRLIRVLKLLKSLPKLQVIVIALLMAVNSIIYIGAITLLIYYMFAILGIILFQENDPWHFGSLHTTMITLTRIATFEDWTDVMYINILGCEHYGYTDDQLASQCTKSYAGGALAAAYFVLFVIIGALVLLTLFIGVVTTAMDDATKDQNEQMELEARVKAISEDEKLSTATVDLYRRAFALLDLDKGGTIEEEELRVGLEAIGKTVTDDELAEMMKEVDEDESGEIDFAEFVEFMVNVKRNSEQTRREFMQAANADPSKWDLDGDGIIDDDERQNMINESIALGLSGATSTGRRQSKMIVDRNHEVYEQLKEDHKLEDIRVKTKAQSSPALTPSSMLSPFRKATGSKVQPVEANYVVDEIEDEDEDSDDDLREELSHGPSPSKRSHEP